MGHGNNIGKYQLGRTIGEGTFAKVKLAVDSTDGRPLAIKIMDKKKVMQSHLKDQVIFHLTFPLLSLREVLMTTTPNMLLSDIWKC
jgi:serine/threonine protein kinase